MASLDIKSTKKIIQQKESMEITATLTNNINNPISGMKVYFYQEVNESPLDPIYLNYQSINQTFTELRTYLINQLEKCFLTDLDSLNFTELIEKVGEIDSVEYYNSNNIKPLNKPEINTSNLTTYNESLYFRVRYYMKLLAYYLCLKGVPTDKIADQHDLLGLISLIELIDVRLPTTMTVQEITEEYYFGLNILLDYTLVDIYGDNVKDGEIAVEADGILYDSIPAGNPIAFTPLRVSEKINGIYEPIDFTFTYLGSDKYKKYPSITRSIIIKPAKITLDVFVSNINLQSEYYGSTTTGYTNDTWNILIKTYNYKGEILPNIPFLLSTDDDIINLLSLNGDKDVVQYNDTVTLKATLSNILNNQIEGQKVFFTKDIGNENLSIDLSLSNNITTQDSDITFTASITDDNDNGVEGIVVDFYRDSYTLDSSLLNSAKTILGVTDENGTCSIDCIINQVGNQVINIKTNYEDTNLMTNTEKEHNVITYYNPLWQDRKEYVDYMGKNNYEYELIIRNKITGAYYDNSFDGEQILIFLDDILFKTVTVNNGKAVLSISSENELQKITVGKHILLWSFNGNQRKSIINILSNFILPTKNKFFLPDTPSFYYTPLYTETYQTENWTPIIRKKATAWVYYYGENIEEENIEIEENEEENYDEPSNHYELILIDDEPKEMYTDSNGILHDFKEYSEYIVPRKYAVKLKTSSDNLNEELIDFFEYEIAKPFNIFFDEDQSNKKEKAVFNIKVYDKEHYQIGQHTDYISFNKNFTGLYSINEIEYDEYYNINIVIPAREETIGTNTLTVTINNYTENTNFKLADKIFKLLTNNVDIGEQQIQIQCYDNDIEDIVIDNEYIVVNEYTKTNEVFIIDATFVKAGDIDFTVSTEEDNESFVITVNKGNIIPTIIIEQYTPYTAEVFDEELQTNVTVERNYVNEVDECYYTDINTIHIRLEMEPIYENIEIVYEFDDYDESYMSNDDYKSFTIPDIAPGEYNVSFTYYSNSSSSYNSFSVNKTFTVLKATPIHEVSNQYTTFKDMQFFIYEPEFTEENPETLIAESCNNGSSSQINGVWDFVGYYLAEGWANTGTWECDFDISGNMRYVGVDVLCAISSSNQITRLIGGWEGPIATNPPGTYTRDNDSTLSFLPKKLAYKDTETTTNTSTFTECHVNMKKTSPTTLIITKTNGECNNGSVVYEWQNLSNYPKVTIGAHINPAGCAKIGTVKIKNFIVRGVY